MLRRIITEARAAQVCSARLAHLAPQALLALLPPIFFVHKKAVVFSELHGVLHVGTLY